MTSCKPDNHPQTMDKEKSAYKKRTTHLMSVVVLFLCGSISQGKKLNCSTTFLSLYRKDFTLSGQPADGSQDFGFRQFGFFLQLGKIQLTVFVQCVPYRTGTGSNQTNIHIENI